MSNVMEMVPYTETGMVMPLASAAQAKQAIEAYEALKAAIIQPRDVFREERNGKTVEYLKKSFWRRLATSFGLSLIKVSEQRETDEKGALAYSAFYKAVAPNGREVEADGYCSRSEPGHQNWTEHSIRATAHTRAKNRAISDMVGGGEVSYEEMHGDFDDDAPAPARQQPASRQQQPSQWPKEARLALRDRWFALQPDEPGMRTQERFNARMRQMFNHGAPFSDGECQTMSDHVDREEARRRVATVTEDAPATQEPEPIPFDLRGVDTGEIGA